MSAERSAVVAGIGATRFAVRSRASEAALAVRAIAAALADAGLGPADVDGVVRFDREAVWEYDLAYGCGIGPLAFYAAVPFGAGAAPALLRLAALAIGEGLATVVLGWHARSRRATQPPLVGAEQFQVPFGLDGTAAVCALLFRRHAHRYGTPPEALEVVATTLRRQAARNLRALLRRRPLGRAAYRQSPLVAEPLRRADVASEAAGACAFVVTSLARARDLRRPPVAVLATMQAGLPCAGRQLVDFVRFDRERAVARAARALFGTAGLPPGGADVAFFHDAASPLVLLGLEDFGFCPRGASGPFVLGGGLRGGRVNPSGGQLAEAHLDGINNLVAGVRAARRGATVLVAGSALEPTSAVLLGLAC
jgi:acetyl-CoA acetyltransferase